jgi:hypothetical protein
MIGSSNAENTRSNKVNIEVPNGVGDFYSVGSYNWISEHHIPLVIRLSSLDKVHTSEHSRFEDSTYISTCIGPEVDRLPTLIRNLVQAEFAKECLLQSLQSAPQCEQTGSFQVDCILRQEELVASMIERTFSRNIASVATCGELILELFEYATRKVCEGQLGNNHTGNV